MKSVSLARSDQAGFDCVHVDTGPLSLKLIPELGGKIASLRDQRTGREWLWRHPRMPYARVPHGGSYTEAADTGGWDECFPSVAPCEYPSAPWAGAAIQDHGELWSQAAELVVVEDGPGVKLITRWRGVALPYSLERTITLAEGSAQIHLGYTATNSADDPVQFIWSAHPLLAIEPGMRLLVAPAARFNRWACLPSDLLAADRGLHYPLTVNEVDLAALPPASAGFALKLWSDPLPADGGWATLRAGDGELRMTWDVVSIWQIAFWLNLGAWAGDGGAPYYNLGLEPCIGAQDSLAEAVTQRGLFDTLPPRGSKSWRLDVELAA